MTNEELKIKMLEFIATFPNGYDDYEESWWTPAQEAGYVLTKFAKFLGIDESGLEVE